MGCRRSPQQHGILQVRLADSSFTTFEGYVATPETDPHRAWRCMSREVSHCSVLASGELFGPNFRRSCGTRHWPVYAEFYRIWLRNLSSLVVSDVAENRRRVSAVSLRRQ